MNLKTFQKEFTSHIRNPKRYRLPHKTPPQRMKVYLRLLFNNVESVLESCFPVTQEILGKKRWKTLVKDFFECHSSQSPYYREIPHEFIQFLEEERPSQKSDPIFLNALAHYEWIELKLYLTPDAEASKKTKLKKNNLLKQKLNFSNALELVAYPFYVDQINKKTQPRQKEKVPIFYLIYRNKNDGIEFKTLNFFAARLLDLLLNHKMSGAKALKKIQKETKHPDLTLLQKESEKFLWELVGDGVIF
ncbi:MAG: putative DNA-binding domain-containing protein [Deltaproteobacteria bacterium]|nr:putative DNA-binding domain-containing protein [Deltaproteobacteria bacterium]